MCEGTHDVISPFQTVWITSSFLIIPLLIAILARGVTVTATVMVIGEIHRFVQWRTRSKSAS